MKLIVDIPNSLYANLAKIGNGSIASKRIIECVKHGKPYKVDVLDKIRAEIEKLQKSCDVAQDMFKESQEMVYCYKAFKQAYTKVIGIIDKYRNEVNE